MLWGPGPELGILTIIGYLAFLTGIALVWRNRDFAFVWLQDEMGVCRRSLSRYVVSGPFYQVRRDTRLKAILAGFWRALLRVPQSRAHFGAILLFVGSLLFLLDLFI